MLFKLKQIKGAGRGHQIGFPTINLAIPSNIILDEGIYATWVTIGGHTYKGALHYGPIPTFDLKEKTMEIHLIGITDEDVPVTKDKDKDIEIEIDIVDRLRSVKKFENTEELVLQIDQDIKNVNFILE